MSSERLLELFVRPGVAGTHPELRWFALVDHAGCPGLVDELRRRSVVGWRSLFEGSREEGALEAAPLLFSLNESVGAHRAFVAWLWTQCRSSNALSLLRSPLQPAAMFAALKRRLDARLPDDMPVLLRYFDTRVLVALLDVLNERQRGEFMGVAVEWVWLDRHGQPRSATCEAQNEDAWPASFQFDEHQQAALIDAGEADAICQLLRSSAPDVCVGRSPGELHDQIAAALPKAKSLGLEAPRGLGLFCALVLQRGIDFDKEGRWAQAMERARGQPSDFYSAVAWAEQED